MTGRSKGLHCVYALLGSQRATAGLMLVGDRDTAPRDSMKFSTRIRVAGLALVLVVAAAAGSVGLGATTRHASALSNCTVSDQSVDSEEQAFLTLINQYRAQ